MDHKLKLTIIRDPVHNYIPISGLEKRIIDQPLFLRLRYVTQNGLAHLVYPSNRTSRFLHSLGTMHVGGLMLRHALTNTPPPYRKCISSLAKNAVSERLKPHYSTPSQVTNYLSRENDVFYQEYGFSPDREEDLYLIILLQSLRLACAMHDVGHFPFSHTTELVLVDFFWSRPTGVGSTRRDVKKVYKQLFADPASPRKPTELHESIGRHLMEEIFTKFSDEHATFAKLCFSVAEAIAAPKQADPLLRCLHTIVSGNLDADRCDYVRRDGLASAFEFGDFDLDRIFSTIRFVKSGQNIRLLPTTVAQSALEAFFLARYQIYRWLVFHPIVVQVDVSLSRALTILLEVACGEHDDKLYGEIKRVLECMEFRRLWEPFRDKDTYGSFVTCDEGWFSVLLRDVQAVVAKTVGQNTEGVPLKLLALKIYLDLVCDRVKHLKPLWKRQEDYKAIADEVARLNHTAKPGRAPSSTEPGPVVAFNRLVGGIVKRRRRFGNVALMRDLEKEIQQSLARSRVRSIGILGKVLHFEPYKTTWLFDPDTGRKVRLEDLSTIVRTLQEMWDYEIQFRAFGWARTPVDGNPGMYIIKKDPYKTPSPNQLARAIVEGLRSMGLAPPDKRVKRTHRRTPRHRRTSVTARRSGAGR